MAAPFNIPALAAPIGSTSGVDVEGVGEVRGFEDLEGRGVKQEGLSEKAKSTNEDEDEVGFLVSLELKHDLSSLDLTVI